MTIQQINDSSAALYITPADLKSRGISSHSDLTLEGALSLATDAFRDAGITLTGSIEIEAFPDACGVLIFAHIRPPREAWLTFSDLETLLTALSALIHPCQGGSLYWWEGEYWFCTDDRQAALQLSEFGRQQAMPPQREAQLSEHGTPILRRNAPAVLARYFTPAT